MPKVSIREIDNTGAETLEFLNYTVLVPGPKLGVRDGNKFTVLEAGLFESSAQFSDELEAADANGEAVFAEGTYDYKNDLGHLMIKELLNRGLTVYYVPAYELDDKYELTAMTFETPLFREFKDKGKYDLRFITLGGLYRDVDNFVDNAQEALMCAGDRGDAVAILDVPATGFIGSSQEEVELNNTDLIDTWVQENFATLANEPVSAAYRDGVQNKRDINETYGRYASIFSPAVNVKFGKEYKTVPAGFNYLICFGKYIQNFKAWFAMSGSVRGVSPYTGIVPTITFGDADVNALQVRSGESNDGHVATNVICNIRPYGNIIWGNRTMHPLSKPNNDVADAAVQLTASSFLNIRQLCIDIKKTLYRAARRFSFEPNSDALWYNFKGAITPLLDDMKANQGIKGYQVIKVKTNKKALLVARIKIVPIEAVEDFDLTVELADSIEVTEE